MRFIAIPFVAASLLLALAGCQTDSSSPPDAPKSSAAVAPPKKPEAARETPLLLDDAPETTDANPGAINNRCRVCHLNLAEEELALVHAKASIGCAQCHGASDAHIADESWASGGNGTAPDIMYPKDKVNPLCLSCHPKDKIDPTAHRTFWAKSSKEKHCTDCHGEHYLAQRKCKWK